MPARFAAILVGLMLACLVVAPALAEPPSPVDVFTAGEAGYHTYRIPAALATAKGTLLAFAEARASTRDQAANKIVVKRSEDGGKTWGPVQTIADDGQASLNNPCALLVRQTGRVLLFYQRYPAGVHERQAGPGLEGPRVVRSLVIHSDDDGRTWSAPRDITAHVKRPTATSIASGPGIGIQLRRGPHAGRLLVPFNQGPYKTCSVYAVFSDDGGEHWVMGDAVGDTGDGGPNEVQFVELDNGRVQLNARGVNGKKFRKVATSDDGGKTWSPLRNDPALPEPRCMGSLLRIEPPGGARPVILFANPDSQTQRINGTLRVSRDDARTWSDPLPIYTGSFAYSCLVPIGGGAVGCLFERDGYRKISFVNLGSPWLAAP